jgi:hypothetical protein
MQSIIIGAIALVVIIAIVVPTVRATQSQRLARRFAPKYDRTVERGELQRDMGPDRDLPRDVRDERTRSSKAP